MDRETIKALTFSAIMILAAFILALFASPVTGAEQYNKTDAVKFIEMSRFGFPMGSGTAFIIAPGYAITAAHVAVINEADYFVDGIPAAVMARDDENDIALLKGNFDCPCLFPAIPQIGERAYTVGYIYGRELQREAKASKPVPIVNSGLIQFISDVKMLVTVSVGPGNSGGPIIVFKGTDAKVVGMVTQTTQLGDVMLGPSIWAIAKFLNKSGVEWQPKTI